MVFDLFCPYFGVFPLLSGKVASQLLVIVGKASASHRLSNITAFPDILPRSYTLCHWVQFKITGIYMVIPFFYNSHKEAFAEANDSGYEKQNTL
jgi:hypothetical protein